MAYPELKKEKEIEYELSGFFYKVIEYNDYPYSDKYSLQLYFSVEIID